MTSIGASSERVVFPPQHRCIYCDRDVPDALRFGDEHIVPEGLASTLLLKEASCRACEARINVFETRVLRETFEHARTHLNIRSKKRRPRPSTLPLGFSSGAGGKFEWREVDLARHPFMILVPMLERPGLLTGRAPSPDFICQAINTYGINQAHTVSSAGASAFFQPF